MAYNGFKGVGPRGLGTSPLKQTNYRNTSAKEEPKGEIVQLKMPEARTGMGAMGLVGGTAVKAGMGLVKGAINLGKRFFGKPKNAKAIEAFLKAAPKDPTKTTRIGNYANNTSSNLRSGSQGGTTTVGSRRNYNNSGSN
tara:strand:+ start:406 stop:822 length:417 start_codon:yes stop_codon:yes gene_type:complete